MSSQTVSERLNRIAEAAMLHKTRTERWPKEIVAEVRALRAEGMSTSRIAAAAGIFAMSIYKWMSIDRSNNTRPKKTPAPAKQPPIKVFTSRRQNEESCVTDWGQPWRRKGNEEKSDVIPPDPSPAALDTS